MNYIRSKHTTDREFFISATKTETVEHRSITQVIMLYKGVLNFKFLDKP